LKSEIAYLKFKNPDPRPPIPDPYKISLAAAAPSEEGKASTTIAINISPGDVPSIRPNVHKI
jgi:hypothetical protein